MESTYLFNIAPRVYKILTSANWLIRGYRPISMDKKDLSFIVKRTKFLFKNYFFEVKVEQSKANITCVSVKQLYGKTTQQEKESELLLEILRLF